MTQTKIARALLGNSFLVWLCSVGICSAGICCLPIAKASAEKASLLTILEENRRPIEFKTATPENLELKSAKLERPKLTGPGAEWLKKEAGAAEFFLIGEVHGVAEVLEFAHALLDDLAPLGYRTYVTEVGPFSGQEIERLARDPRGLEAFRAFFRRYPFSIPFALYEEEASLLRSVVANDRGSILGIDQEFFLAPTFLLESIRSAVDEETPRRDLVALLAKERDALDTLLEEKNISAARFLMNVPEAPELERLAAHYQDRSPSHEAEVIEAIAKSREIYQAYYRREYGKNNSTRARWMKEKFFETYEKNRERSTPCKYLIKLGSNHVVRGKSPMGIYDIGQSISKRAEESDTGSFHLLALPRRGTQNTYLPFLPEAAKKTPLNPSASPYGGVLEILGEQSGWNLYDLRPLREMDDEIEEALPALLPFVKGCDALLIFDEVRAATLLE